MAESLDLSYARSERDRRADELKRISQNVNNWGDSQETSHLVAKILSVVSEWPVDNLPDLGDVFWSFQMDCLLLHAIIYRYEGRSYRQAEQFIDFVIATGYRYQPDDDVNQEADGRAPSLWRHHSTPVHYAARHEYADYLVGKLFRIYDDFHVNYTDEEGFSHFHAACVAGCDEVVERFLALGHDPNCPAGEASRRESKIDPPLHLALAHRRGGVAKLLLMNGANPRLANEAGSTPLHQICIRDDAFGLAELFFGTIDGLGLRVQIDAKDGHDDAPLHLAATGGYRNLVRLLLRRGADPNLANGKGATALHIICQTEAANDRLLEVFLKVCKTDNRRLAIDAPDPDGYPALHLAMRRGHRNMARMLLAGGADPNVKNEYGWTALHVVCGAKPRCDNKLLEMIFEKHKGVDREVAIDPPDDQDGNTPLHLAVLGDHAIPVRSLLWLDADPNSTNAEGHTALHLVCRASRRSDCYDRLPAMFFAVCDEIDREVAIDARDPYGNTPLLLVAAHPTEQMLRLLLGRGADPNAVNDQGHTPLLTMYRNGVDYDLTRLFFEICDELQLRVLVDTLNYRTDETPLLWAVLLGEDDHRGVELLLRRGADPNLANEAGMTPLHVICQAKNDSNLLEFFFRINREINRVIRVDARDETGLTPLQWAVARQLPDVVEVLLDNGADLSNFVFPTDDLFDKSSVKDHDKIQEKLIQASGVLAVVQTLVERGYEMSESDARRIMKFFVNNKLFEHPDRSWLANEELAFEAVRMEVKPDLSLYDLIHLSARDANNRVSYTDYWKLAKGHWWNASCRDEAAIRGCTLHLCEKLSRMFLLTWTREPLARLMRGYVLPAEIREFILQRLENRCLCTIGLSAAGRIRDDDQHI